MSKPTIPLPVKPVLSILSARWDRFWPGLRRILEERLSPIDHISETIPFTQTTYYNKELGTPITRRLISFEKLMPMDELPNIKLWTNTLENNHADPQGNRLVNLDPGYLNQERLVLATGKNFTHRIYLREGIWADLTLIFQRGAWVDLPWTFPDYATAEIKKHLTRIRTAYTHQLRAYRQTKESHPCQKV
ncbi:MAG: GTP-binding protein [Deltaproteobacteria bacterium]|nr:MAG: GTP-binding protein [Deltaproteobacteria bacterium]